MKFLYLMVTLSFLMGCSQQPHQSSSSVLSAINITNESSSAFIKVLDLYGNPIPYAHILIGPQIHMPFEDNFLQTNERGEILIPESWNQPEMVTIDAPGFIRATFYKQDPKSQIYRLNYEVTQTRYEVKGFTSGYGTLKSDGILDFGLVIPALTKVELFSFQPSMVISPETIRIPLVMGQSVDIPTNISIPKQTEKYYFNINFDKPDYKLVFGNEGPRLLWGVHGRFPFSKVADKLRAGKSFFEVMNDFTFVAGTTKTVQIAGPKTTQNISIDQTQFDTIRKVKSPRFERGLVMLSLALQEQNGLLIPTDVKKLTSASSMDLRIPTTKNKLKVVSILQKEDLQKVGVLSVNRQQLTGHFQDFIPNATPSFLPLIETPQISPLGLITKPPQPSAQIACGGTYLAISKVFINASDKSEITYKDWEFYSSDWQDSYIRPLWPLQDKICVQSCRWEISYLGRQITQTKQNFNTGLDLLDAATHGTHNAIDY